MVGTDPRRIALACAVAAVAVSGSAALITIGFAGWEPSILVRMDAGEPMAEIAREHDPGFAFVPAEGHYDGVYMYAIALDPFGRDEDVYERIDLHEYRYGHAGYAWLSGFAALGDAGRLPVAMLAVSLAGMGAAGWAVSRLAEGVGRSAWWGMLVAANPGLVYAVTVLTSEPAGVALAAAGVLAWLRRRTVLGPALLAAACLVKEPFAFVPAGLFLWELAERLRRRAEPGTLFRMALLAASVLPLLWWYLYLRVHFGMFPFQAVPEGFGAPLVGWFDSFRRAVDLSRAGASQIGSFTVPLLTITAAAMLVGVARAVRVRSPFDLMFLVFAAFATTFNWLLLLYPKDLVREFVLPVLLLPAAIAGVAWRRAPLPEPHEAE